VTFDWNHSYGPLDWPREGTTLLNVEADRPHYWKAETLDRFDGLRWVRSESVGRTRPLDELPPRPNPRWDERIRVTVRALRTDFVVAAGTPYLVTGAGDAVSGSADGTVRRLDEPLERGDSYTVRTYDPDPTPRQMRAASDVYTPGLGQYTGVALPVPGGETRHAALGSASVSVPLRGGALSGTPGAERRLATSPYGRTFRLARRLGAGAPTVYDVARRIERHLERSYSYSERPPRRRYPLEAFLFRDRTGYCQQFSGAMALMLRMVGVPARVVSGFSPGSFNRDSGEYRVRDLDAHSWVEVFFNGIGWVTFDPTPPAAPADRPGGESDPTRAVGDSPGSISSNTGGGSGDQDARSPAADAPGGEGGGTPVGAILLATVLLSAVAAVVALARRAAPTPAAAADASLHELERALPRLGWELGPGTTLLELERRLARAASPRAAAYVAVLRAGRFSAGGARAPAPAERRALRRELTAAGGLRGRARGFVALPPLRRFSRT
jgi:transglutaminase-like putative cysteine protease